LKIETVEAAALPAHWRDARHADRLRDIGMEWLNTGRTAVLAVPSAVVPLEQNYLMNPLHKAFRQIRVNAPQPFEFDYRMWRPK
jgi:RES domain-containing protein